MKEGLISWSVDSSTVEVFPLADGAAVFHAGSGETHWLGGTLGMVMVILHETECVVDAVEIHTALAALLAEPRQVATLAEVEAGLEQLRRMGLIREAEACTCA